MDGAATECAREYYRALDEHDYDALGDLLAPEFVHDRPDRSFEGRERFVRFVREERPNRETTHRIEGIYCRGGDGPEEGERRKERPGPETADVAVRGRLLDGEEVLFEFVDLFTVAGGRIERVDTFARSV